jgi:hypothetical protein
MSIYYRSLIQTTEITEAIPTFALKSNNNLLQINFTQGASLTGTLTIDWGDGVTETYADQSFSTLSHTYTKQNADLVEINITTDLNIATISLGSSAGSDTIPANNQLTEIATGELPSSLTELYLDNNLLTIFNTNLALPSTLIAIGCNYNLLTVFNPTFPLPISLRILYLNNNLLTTFNPTLPLPNSIQQIHLSFNQLTIFNTTLPSTFRTLRLLNNLMDTPAVDSVLILLDNTITSGSGRTFYLIMSPSAPPSGAGLTAKASLQSKGCTVLTD